MQINRRKVTFYGFIFIWLMALGGLRLLTYLLKQANWVIYLSFGITIGLLIVLLLINRYVIKDRLIFFTKRDDLVIRISSYLVLVPLILNIVIPYLKLKTTPELVLVAISTGLLFLIGLLGTIYVFTLEWRNNLSHAKEKEPENVIEAEFSEKKEDHEGLN